MSLQRLLMKLPDLARQCQTLDQFYRQLTELMRPFPGVDLGYVALCAPHKRTDQLSFLFNPHHLVVTTTVDELLEGPVGQVYRHSAPLILDENELTELRQLNQLSPLETDCEAWLGVPLMQQEQVIGVIVIQSYLPATKYSKHEQELLEFIAQSLIDTMERLQSQALASTKPLDTAKPLTSHLLYTDKLKRHQTESLHSALMEIIDIGNRNQDITEFYGAVHKILGQLLHADNCYMALLSDRGDLLSFPYYHCVDLPEAPPSRLPGDGLAEQIIRLQQPLKLTRADIEQHFQEGTVCQRIERNFLPQQDWLGVPLKIHGKARGALVIFSQKSELKYSSRQLSILNFIAQHVSAAIERQHAQRQRHQYQEELERQVVERTQEISKINKHLKEQISQRMAAEHQLRHDALHDALTGLPNRALLMNRLEQSLKHTKRHARDRFAILFIDLDRFKLVNDSLGHLVGDKLLKEVAKRLQHCIRDNDTLARFGGDEFVILLDTIHNGQEAEEISERILEHLKQPFKLEGRELFPGASIGIVMSDPHRQANAEDLLRDADAALYQAKSNGRGCYQFASQRLQAEMTADFDRESQLRQALLNHEMTVHYQPIIDLQAKQIVGVEALARWEHPQRGQLPPQNFIPLARKTGAIADLDHFMISQVARDYPRLRDRIGDDCWVHINLDLSHLRIPSRLDHLEQKLKTTGVQLNRLALEFSEKDPGLDQPNLQKGLERLTALGVQLGLDDVGTGYGAMTMLPTLPLSFIKLDRSLTEKSLNCDRHRAMVESLSSLTNRLNIILMVKGVEEENQMARLTDLGCCRGQGFLFSKPNALDASDNGETFDSDEQSDEPTTLLDAAPSSKNRPQREARA